MKKYAICISGSLRTFERTYQNFFEKFSNIIPDSDIFLHIWNNENYVRAIELYKPKDVIISEIPIELLKNINTKYEFNKRQHYQKYIAHMFYSIFLLNKLKKSVEELNEKKYDCVFRLRYDVIYHDYIKCEMLNNLENKTIYLFNDKYHIEWIGYNDQFAFGRSNDMDYYSSVFENFKYLVNGKDLFHPETLLKNHLNLFNYKVKYVDIDTDIVL